MASRNVANRRPGKLRIVAGDLRGRTIEVIDSDGLRPTGDRIRQTLFDWLQKDIRGSHCLDMFSGTGALGIEAASRGAETVLMIEKSSAVIAQLRRNLSKLGLNPEAEAYAAEVKVAAKKTCLVDTRCGDATSPEVFGGRTFDILFIDPPFAMQLHSAAVSALLAARALMPSALIYIESARRDAEPVVPNCWEQWRIKTVGDVVARVYRAP